MASSAAHPPMDLANLTEEQFQSLEAMREAFKDATNPDQEDPTSWFQLNDWTYLRYLKARSFDVKQATDMLNATLEFRRKWQPHRITREEVAPHLNQKVWRLLGRAKDASPVQITCAGLFDPSQIIDDESFSKCVIFEAECVLREMQKTGWTSDRTFVIFDLEGYSLMKQATPTGMHYLRLMLDINDKNYPELLGKCVIYNAPMVFRGVWSVISPWLDEETKNRIVFVSNPSAILEFIDAQVLLPKHGGEMETDYPVLYWEKANDIQIA